MTHRSTPRTYNHLTSFKAARYATYWLSTLAWALRILTWLLKQGPTHG